MAHVLYGTMLVQPGNVETVRRYLYGATEVVETARVERDSDRTAPSDPDLVFLILRTEERDERATEYAQQSQIDRLASGMYGATGGFATRQDARDYAQNRAYDNGWGIGTFGPFVLSAVEA